MTARSVFHQETAQLFAAAGVPELAKRLGLAQRLDGRGVQRALGRRVLDKMNAPRFALTDVYEAFRRMLLRGEVPTSIKELLAESQNA